MASRALYFDCFSGISGDMTVGALLDLGGDGERLRAEIAKIDLAEAPEVSWKRVNRTGITATKFDVEPISDSEAHRSHRQIAELIEGSALAEGTKRRALAIFARIAEAEAKIHGVPVEEVHFHEVGAVDSIIDIVAVSHLLETLAPDVIISSSITLGAGRVRTMHGIYPVPAPATLELLRGARVRSGEVAEELTTPTGAGILAAMVDRWGAIPEIEIEAIGYGAGTKVSETRPNVLRLILGTLVEGPGGSASHDHAHRHDHDHAHAAEHAHDYTHDHLHDHLHEHEQGENAASAGEKDRSRRHDHDR